MGKAAHSRLTEAGWYFRGRKAVLAAEADPVSAA
jgi:hypothetical protein